eukprot:COSAG01_NODE_71844_length_254_cov_1.587097_1_plen_84_part_11
MRHMYSVHGRLGCMMLLSVSHHYIWRRQILCSHYYRLVDAKTGRPYYVNRQTKETTWTKPAGAAAAGGTPSKTLHFKAHKDDKG